MFTFLFYFSTDVFFFPLNKIEVLVLLEINELLEKGEFYFVYIGHCKLTTSYFKVYNPLYFANIPW